MRRQAFVYHPLSVYIPTLHVYIPRPKKLLFTKPENRYTSPFKLKFYVLQNTINNDLENMSDSKNPIR